MVKIETNNVIGPHVKLKDRFTDQILVIRKFYADQSKQHIILQFNGTSITLPVKDLIDAAHTFGVYQDSLSQKLKDRIETDPIFEEAYHEIECLRAQVRLNAAK